MMHFPSVSDFPPIFEKNFLTFLRLFLVIDHKFRIPPILPVLEHFPSDSRKFLISPCFQNFPSVFKKFNSSLHTLRVIPPTLTMMHLCITQCTYWTPLAIFLGEVG